MSYQYHEQDQGGYGIPSYPTQHPPRQRQMPPTQGRPQQRGQPPMRPNRPGGPPTGGRFPVRPQGQQQQYAQPMPPPPLPTQAHESTENLYDGSAYGEPEYAESDQWPLPAPSFAQPQARSNSPSSNGARRPPQRPQRPDHQQSIQDPPRARVAPANKQYQQAPPPPPSYHGSGQWTNDGYESPSAGVQQPSRSQSQYQQGAFTLANKRPPLGPPPSARRGPPSYFPQIAPVHPIVEETDSMRGSIRDVKTGHTSSMYSYASSNAIPIGIPDYYLEHRDSAPSFPGAERHISVPDSEDDMSPIEPFPPGGRESRFSDRRDESSPEPVALVRQASYGRKSKPTLTTVKSSEKVRRGSGNDGLSSLPSRQRGNTNPKESMPAMAKELGFDKETMAPSKPDTDRYEVDKHETSGDGDKAFEAGGAAAVAAAAVPAPVIKRLRDDAPRTSSSDVLTTGSGLLDPSSSESEKEIKKKRSKELLGVPVPKKQSRNRTPSPLTQEVDDPRISDILAGLEKGGALTPTETEQLKAPGPGMSERAGKRRPPRLNVDAVRDAEVRGSLTSLPDLIKRATRLASNLDRGKTASRLGMNWIEGADSDEKRRSGSISDMLASFPPPGLATPPASRDGVRRSYTNWSKGSNLRHSHLPSESDAGERGRRKRKCCGLPLYAFFLLLLLLFLLIAAAVVVPVVLIVLPKHNEGSSSALSKCQSKLTCQNGGTNVITSSGTCQCICANGYSGNTCATASTAGCTTISVGSTKDATVGSAIPRLLSGAQSNFSVALDGPSLLGLFSGNALSCNSENELVTFNNNAGTKRSLEEHINAIAQPTPILVARQTMTSSGPDGAATSNGIIFETGSPTITGGSVSSTTSSSPSATSSSSNSTSPSSSSTGDSSTSLDFARVAVLYVYQASGKLATAETAQSSLQSYFTDGKTSTGETINANNISLGNGFTCNLSGHSISLANGTTVGSSAG